MTENLTPWTDPELEARVVALVLGEASDFERDQLRQLLAANPDLAAFQKRIEAVHGLLIEASAEPGMASTEQPGWQLPGARRQPLLDVLTTTVPVPQDRKQRLRFLFHPAVWTAAAACLVILGAITLRQPADQFAASDSPASPATPALTTAPPEKPSASPYRASSDAKPGDRERLAVLARKQDGLENDRPLSEPKLERPAESLAESGQAVALQFGRALRRAAGTVTPEQAAKGGASATGGEAGTVVLNEEPALPPSIPANGSFTMGPSPQSGSPGKDQEALALPSLAARDRDVRAASVAGALAIREIENQADESDGFLALQKARKAKSIPETATAEEPFSTFSLHVSDVSFKLAQAALGEGKWPDPDRVRIEEFVNAFDYGDPSPAASEPIACALEQAVHPFQQGRNLLRISLRTSSAGRGASTPLRLTLVLDSSGSMERSDRRQTLQAAFDQLSGLLHPSDRVTLISFARQPRLLADQLPGDQSRTLPEIVANTPSEGGTNLEAALQLAAEKAREHFLPAAQNRIVLFTDGAANLGDAEPSRLAQFVATLRRSGIAFDTAGIGSDGLNDAILEALSRKGDGRYYLLNRPEDAGANFASQIAGAFRPAALDTKVQVWFNPTRVRRYRLLGCEDHRLKPEDFHNDQVDAAELAAAETGVALYQFEPLPDGDGDAGYISVRFQERDTRQVIERRWPIPYDPKPQPFDLAPAGIRLAASAAFLAAKLGDDPLAPGIDLATLDRAAANDELRTMIRQTQSLSLSR